jgi:signal transduction histidine kinase
MKTKVPVQNAGILNELLLAHELMHELTAIKWSLSMINDGKFGAVGDEQKDILGKLISKNDNLISLVDGLLGGGHSAGTGNSDVVESTRYVINHLMEEAARKHITISFQKPEIGEVQTPVEKAIVGMAIKNIIDNAIKYTPENGKISVGVAMSDDKKYIQIHVTDSGIGISKEEKEKLFTQFYRSENAAKANPVGSGMGLFITRQIMLAHQGDIRVESGGEGKGSTFYIDFPLAK